MSHCKQRQQEQAGWRSRNRKHSGHHLQQGRKEGNKEGRKSSPCQRDALPARGAGLPTSRGACTSMNSSKIRWALEASLAAERVFLKSSQASQNSRFSSLNSVFRKARKAASPSARETRELQWKEKEGMEHSNRHPPIRLLEAIQYFSQAM